MIAGCHKWRSQRSRRLTLAGGECECLVILPPLSTWCSLNLGLGTWCLLNLGFSHDRLRGLAQIRLSDEKDQRVGLWMVDGIGTQVLELRLDALELHLLLLGLQVLEVDGATHTGVSDIDIVVTVRVVEMHTGVHGVVDVLVLVGNGGGGCGLVRRSHFLDILKFDKNIINIG